MKSIPESDWKKLRAMKDELLDVACKKIFVKIRAAMDQKGITSHKAYLEVWKILKEEDDKIAGMFDDLKRSSAIYKILALKRNGLISDEELAEFSEQTQETLRVLTRI